MKLLIRNGRVLTSGGMVLAVKPPYADLWGYAQAKAENKADVYEYIYQCMADGFTVQTRTVEGYADPITVDGGAVADLEGFRRLVIPLYQFNITSNAVVYDWISRVVRDNFELCYASVSSTFRATFTKVGGSGSRIISVAIIVPNDTLRAHARDKMVAAVEPLKAKVREVLNLMPRDDMTEIQKRNLVKVVHDWLLERTYYLPHLPGELDDFTVPNYWSQTAYSALTDEVIVKPVCVGYASATAYLLNKYLINCVYVEGYAEGTYHAWNMVSFACPMGTFDADNAKWMHHDVNMDDDWYDMPFDTTKDYKYGDKAVYNETTGRPYPGDRWFCTVPVSAGQWTGANNWVRENTVLQNTHYPWEFCLSNSGVYNYVQDDRGFPCSAPAKKWTYTGDTLYGIAEADWTEPQGGGAV